MAMKAQNSLNTLSTFDERQEYFFCRTVIHVVRFFSMIWNVRGEKKSEEKKSRGRCCSRFDTLASGITIVVRKLLLDLIHRRMTLPGIYTESHSR